MKSFTIFFYCLMVSGFFISCRTKNMQGSNENSPKQSTHKLKPGSCYKDTLFVLHPAVVFFEPDLLQFSAIKQVTDSEIFQSTMHEYRYQIQHAKQYMHRQWKSTRIVNAVNVRYVVFRKIHGSLFIIDLDRQDPCGMFAFDGKQNPILIDMTNVETQVSDYFSPKNSNEG